MEQEKHFNAPTAPLTTPTQSWGQPCRQGGSWGRRHEVAPTDLKIHQMLGIPYIH